MKKNREINRDIEIDEDDTDGFVSTSTAALRCFRFSVCVSSASSASSLISNDVTSKDDCLDLLPPFCPNLAILERSLSLLTVCLSRPAFKRSREKGHAMLFIDEPSWRSLSAMRVTGTLARDVNRSIVRSH